VSKRRELFEVWISRNDGLYPGPKFRLAHDAEEFIAEHAGEASFAVRAPDGHWKVIAARDGDPQPGR
jgi:hypothetical protein